MGAADDFFQSFLKKYPQANSGQLSFEEMNKLLAEFQSQINTSAVDDFDGLSRSQMHELLYNPLSENCLLQVRKNAGQHMENVPILKLADLLIHEISKVGHLKLTTNGNVPARICELLFHQDLIKWKYMEYMGRKIEDEIPYIRPLKYYLLDKKIIKKQKNAVSLTKYGEKFITQPADVRFIDLILYFGNQYHWGNYFRFPKDTQTGQLGWAYSLYLLMKYGDKETDSKFYSRKSLLAFGKAWNEDLTRFHGNFTHSFFDRFTNWFGLVEMQWEKRRPIIHDDLIVRKTELFDQLFQIAPS